MDVLRRISEACWRLLVVGLSVAVAVWLLRQVWPVVVSIIGAMLAALALEPLVTRLQRRRLPRSLAAAMVFLGGLGALGGLAVFSASAVSGDVSSLSRSLDDGVGEIRRWATEGPLEVNPQSFDRAVEDVREGLTRLASSEQLVSVARMAATIVTGILLGLVMVFFFLKDGPLMVDWAVARFPADRQATVRRVGDRARRTLQGYLRGTVIIGVLEGAFIGVLLLALGVSQAIPLAVLTFFAAFFPIVGAVFAGSAAVLVTLVEAGPGRALFAAIAILVLQQVDGDLLQPVVMSNAVRLHPVVVLVALTAGGVVAGITGAFLAVPLTAVISATASELQRARGEPLIELPDGIDVESAPLR